MNDSPLNTALRKFEIVEANLGKAERLLESLQGAIPSGIVFGEDPLYEQNLRDFDDVVGSLPKIDGWKPALTVMDLDEIAQSRLDANEVGDFEAKVSVETQIAAPARELREYRHRFNKKRRALVRDAIENKIGEIDDLLRSLAQLIANEHDERQPVESQSFEALRTAVAEVGMLLGSSFGKPTRWNELNRHLNFGQLGDLHDIVHHDWPAVRAGLSRSMYGENEPLPVEVEDLGVLVAARPKGGVATRLKWEVLDEDDFERLLYTLISSSDGYENPQWLMRTNAPDRGRDLSVQRVYKDPLAGTRIQRVIIQCKHWLAKSVGVAEISMLKEQMKLWEPPRVDVCVIATSGRFSADAVASIERHNQSDSALQIDMWPESHLERLLAERPGIIAQFQLR